MLGPRRDLQETARGDVTEQQPGQDAAMLFLPFLQQSIARQTKVYLSYGITGEGTMGAENTAGLGGRKPRQPRHLQLNLLVVQPASRP